jgi:hypothetical protein
MSTSSRGKSTVRAAAAGSPKSAKGMSGTTPDDGSGKVGQGGGTTPPPGDDRNHGAGKRPQKRHG